MKTVEVMSALKQEVKDLKEVTMDKLGTIERQTIKTNGSIAKAMKDITLVQQDQKNCPARLYHATVTKKDEKDWSIKQATIMVSVIMTFIIIIAQVAISYLM